MRRDLRTISNAMFEPLETRKLFSASVVVTPPGIILHEKPEVKFTADLGTFITIAPATNLHASITWGDGSTSTGVLKADGIIGIDEIKFEVDGTHIYAHAGTYPITATVLQPGPPGTNFIRLVAKFNDTAIVARGNTTLNGAITGTYLLAPTAISVGAEYIFTGKGTAGALGKVTAHTNVILTGPSTTGKAMGTLTLTSISTTAADAGSVTLKLTGTTEKGKFPTTLNYTITGGTGAFAGVTGSGKITVKLGGANVTNAFTFDISSILPPVPVAV